MDRAMDLAMVVLHLHSENGAALVQVLHLESDQYAEFAQFHTALSELQVLFSQFAFACLAQNTSLLAVSATRPTIRRAQCHGFQPPASNTAPRRGISVARRLRHSSS